MQDERLHRKRNSATVSSGISEKDFVYLISQELLTIWQKRFLNAELAAYWRSFHPHISVGCLLTRLDQVTINLTANPAA